MVGVRSAKQLYKDWPDVPALQLKYHYKNHRIRPDTYRIRLLQPVVGAFGQVEKLRYLQLPGSPPGAYLAPTVSWEEVLADPGQTLLITEGELKAACACKHGFPTIGLGGVWSWRSQKLGWSLLPELEAVAWPMRDVVLVFDSDAQTNPAVAQALGALVTELSRRGALPRVAQLPAAETGVKVGLDDFLVAAQDPKKELQAVLDFAVTDQLSRALWKFNGRFSVALTPGCVVDDDLGAKHSLNMLTTLFANEWAERPGTVSEGDVGRPRAKRVQVAKEWLEWELRRTYAGVTYDPGGPRVTADGFLNEWPGWGVEPKRGDVGLWQQLLDHVFQGAEPEARQWFEQWCLYPIRYPGTKLASAASVWSYLTGVGKSLIGQTLGRVYGPKNWVEISQNELDSDFTGWSVNKQLVMVDDISSAESRAKADRLKKLITQETMYVNIKFVATYMVPDHVNYYLTSNRPNSVYLDAQDRRFFVHEVTSPKKPAAWFDSYYTWIGRCGKAPGPGAAALLYYAQEVADLKGFNPSWPPPMTKAKQEMTSAGHSELDAWLLELKHDPASKLRLGQVKLARDLYTPQELCLFFDQERRGQPCAASTMGLKLKEHFPQAWHGETLRPNGSSERFYVIRGQERWAKIGVTREQLEEHVRQTRAKEQGNNGRKY